MNTAEVPLDAEWHTENGFHTIYVNGEARIVKRHFAYWWRDGRKYGYWEWRRA